MAVSMSRMAAAMLCAIPTAAASQDAEAPPLTLPTIAITGDIEAATGPVDGIVAQNSATGTKTDTPLIETPRSVSVVTADEIAQRGGAQTIGETLGYVAGVFSVPLANNRTNFSERIRGFSSYQNGFLDGLADPTGQDRAQPQIEPWGAERVEVLKGPASVLYGQVQPGGIINVVSKRPTFGAAREVQVQGGSNDFYQGAFDLTGVLGGGDRAAWRLVGLAQDAGTQVYGVDDDRLYIAPSLALNLDDATSFTLLTHWRQAKGAEGAGGNLPPALIDELPVDINGGDPTWDKNTTTQWAIGYEFVREITPSVTFVQNARYQRLDTDYRQLYVGEPLPDLGPGWYARTPYIVDETLKALAIDTRVTAAATTGALRHELLAGFDYREQESNGDNDWLYLQGPPIDLLDPVYGVEVGPFELGASSTERIEHTGLYLQDQVEMGRWFATVGGRYDWAKTHFSNNGGWLDETDDGRFSLNAGLLYLFDNGVAPYASYAQSFKPVAGATFDGQPFEPQLGEQYEIGIKYQPPGLDALVTLAAYDLTQSNVLTADPDNQFYSIQTGEVRMRGIELEGRAQIGPVDAILAYTYIDSQITESNDGNQGNGYEEVPPHMASLWLDYGFETGPLRGASLGAGVRYWSDYWGDQENTARNDGSTLIDLAAAYDFGAIRPAWEGMTLSANVSNATDERITRCTAYGCDFGPTRFTSVTLGYAW